MKQCGLGLLMYAQDYDERTTPWHVPWDAQGNTIAGDPWNPPAAYRDSENFDPSWDRLIQPYVKNDMITSCPSDTTVGSGSFSSALANKVGGGKSIRSFSMPASMGGG